jgi:hypothetical protein
MVSIESPTRGRHSELTGIANGTHANFRRFDRGIDIPPLLFSSVIDRLAATASTIF